MITKIKRKLTYQLACEVSGSTVSVTRSPWMKYSSGYFIIIIFIVRNSWNSFSLYLVNMFFKFWSRLKSFPLFWQRWREDNIIDIFNMLKIWKPLLSYATLSCNFVAFKKNKKLKLEVVILTKYVKLQNTWRREVLINKLVIFRKRMTKGLLVIFNTQYVGFLQSCLELSSVQ